MHRLLCQQRVDDPRLEGPGTFHPGHDPGRQHDGGGRVQRQEDGHRASGFAPPAAGGGIRLPLRRRRQRVCHVSGQIAGQRCRSPGAVGERLDFRRLRSLGHRAEVHFRRRPGQHDLPAGGHARTAEADLGFRVDHAGGAGGVSGGVGALGPPASAIRHRADPAAGRAP